MSKKMTATTYKIDLEKLSHSELVDKVLELNDIVSASDLEGYELDRFRAQLRIAREALEAIRDEGGPGGAHEYAEQRVAEVALERIKEMGK